MLDGSSLMEMPNVSKALGTPQGTEAAKDHSIWYGTYFPVNGYSVFYAIRHIVDLAAKLQLHQTSQRRNPFSSIAW